MKRQNISQTVPGLNRHATCKLILKSKLNMIFDNIIINPNKKMSTTKQIAYTYLSYYIDRLIEYLTGLTLASILTQLGHLLAGCVAVARWLLASILPLKSIGWTRFTYNSKTPCSGRSTYTISAHLWILSIR